MAKTVVNAQRVERPLATVAPVLVSAAKIYGIKTSISGKKDQITHSGVLVTTTDGKKYLVHKNMKNKDGTRGTTVEEVKTRLDNRWKKVKPSKKIATKATIGDYIRVGGTNYSLIRDNCHDATERMMKAIKRRRRYI